ncbi:MAG: phytanoyl-CoA dioxygenase family protein [Janthinobacterium lividum]
MVLVRFHLDNCGEENGALRVIPGSHLHGRTPENEIRAMRETPEVVCAVSVGGALLMRPLLLHASSPSRVPGHRRVVHLDFASVQLPNGCGGSPKRLSHHPAQRSLMDCRLHLERA